MRMSFLTVASLGLWCFASGCLYEIRDEILDCEINVRNHRRAWDSWARCYPVYQSTEYLHDFRCGFITGYKSIARGANGCPPAIPPACYWKPERQTPEGKASAHAWFDGYSHGVLAANADGVAEMNQIVTRGGKNKGTQKMLLQNNAQPIPVEMMPLDQVEELFPPPPPADLPYGLENRRLPQLPDPVDLNPGS